MAGRVPWLFQGVRPLHRAGVKRDVLAGLTLAAMNIPQALGYTRIAGMPVVTGLYTLLLPLLAFAALGSSRYLVVAADSATAIILADGLSGMARAESPRYVALAGLLALLTAGCLLLARLFKLGFLADFLSRTVLVGFLSGVGVQVGIAVLGEMLGLPIHGHRTVGQVVQIVRSAHRVHGPTLALSAAVIGVVLACRALSRRLPGPLLAVVGAVVASAAFKLSEHGIAVVGPVASGLPRLGWPHLGLREARALLPAAASCFVMIVAQSAATAEAYAERHRQALDEDSDLLGLAAANAVAALSGAFVVNGSPTQTAMVERSGGRSQVAHLATAAVVAVVLLFLTGPLQYLPSSVLGALVFTIAVGLVDVRGLRDIGRESPGELHLALLTAAVVVGLGVEQGIVLAMVLSLLRHVRHSYRPHTAVLVHDERGEWRPLPAVPGVVTRPGLVLYRFGASLFYANARHFAAEVRALVEGAPAPVRWFLVEASAITSVDYSAARAVRELQQDLRREGVALVLARVTDELRADLDRHRLTAVVGADRIFVTLHEALAAMPGDGPARAPSAARPPARPPV